MFRQIDYFAGEADIKPLLHTWSLAIEEQFYFVFPLVLLWTKKRLRIVVLLSLFGCSLALCMVLASIHPSAAFYFAPTRGWELLFGALCALTPFLPLPDRSSRIAGVVALIILILLFVSPPDHTHPRGNAILCTIATAVLLLYRQPILTSGPVAFVLSKLGDWSYSLYLIHWPLLAFSYNIFAGAPPATATAAVVIASLLLAYLQFRFVEEPFRRSAASSPRVVFSCAALGAATCFVPHWLLAGNRPPPNDAAYQRRANVGLSKECDYKDLFVAKQTCVMGPAPMVAVWGDSIAMSLVEGIRSTLPVSRSQLLQATRSECGPAMGLVPAPRGKHDPARAAACVAFNESVLRVLTTNSSIDAVVLSASFSRYAQPRDSFYRNGTVEPQTQDVALHSFADTIERLKTAGKRVVLVAQPPSIDVNIGLCLERQMSRLFTRAPGDCAIPRRTYEQMHEPSIRLVRAIGLRTNTPIVWPSDFLCQQDVCETQHEGSLLYVDRGHLSYAGSALLGKRVNFGTLLFP
ncbi:MAG: acyltransferase [Bryobacterales bacterium]|nr:acyltransferase [Bryobacterales bacterium]